MANVLEIKKLREETGVGVSLAKEALNLCEDFEVAKEFIKIYTLAVARYKMIDGKKIPYSKEDYVKLARKNVENGD